MPAALMHQVLGCDPGDFLRDTVKTGNILQVMAESLTHRIQRDAWLTVNEEHLRLLTQIKPPVS
jgi:hypothetical protein